MSTTLEGTPEADVPQTIEAIMNDVKVLHAMSWCGEMNDARVHKLFVELGYKVAWEAAPELTDVDCRPRWRRWLSRVIARFTRRS
jgi:hypothetical protein